jgi:hypothetical protein
MKIQDVLINICNAGIVFCEGAGGTRAEIFQFATPNSYADEQSKKSIPCVFYTDFWKKNGLFDAYKRIAGKKQNSLLSQYNRIHLF